jgi:hypothetical protein
MAEARTNSRTRSDVPRVGLAYALLMAVVVAYGLHALFISGPAMRAAAEERIERAIADEDRDVCGSFGLRPDTAQFVACSRELAIVRQRQADRDSAASQGIL